MLLSGTGMLAAMSGAAVILTGNSSGTAALLVIVAGYLVASAAWRRTRELLDPATPEAAATEPGPASATGDARAEVLIPVTAKAGAGA
jgi:hypothetical protein